MERWDPPFDRDPFSLSLAPNRVASLKFKHRSIMFLPKKTISESLRDFPFHRDPVSLLLALDMVASYP